MCAVKGSLYVFCGIDRNNQELSSIEVLAPLSNSWLPIKSDPGSFLTPRFGLGVAEIGYGRIAIFGGYSDDCSTDEKRLTDVLIFDTRYNTLE